MCKSLQVNKAIFNLSHILGFFVTCISYKITTNNFVMFTVSVCVLCLLLSFSSFQVTCHTWQSMKDHYLKQLHPSKKTKFESLFFTSGKDSSIQGQCTAYISPKQHLRSPCISYVYFLLDDLQFNLQVDKLISPYIFSFSIS